MQSTEQIDRTAHSFQVAPDMVVAIRFLSTDGRQPTVQDIKHAIIQLDMMRAMMTGEEIDVTCSVTSGGAAGQRDEEDGTVRLPFRKPAAAQSGTSSAPSTTTTVGAPSIMERLAGAARGGRNRNGASKPPSSQVENAENAGESPPAN